jgi:hypothetical protein
MKKYQLRSYQSAALAMLQAQMAGGGVPAGYMATLDSVRVGNSEGTPLTILSSDPAHHRYPEWARRIGGYLRELPRPESMSLQMFCNQYYPPGHDLQFIGGKEGDVYEIRYRTAVGHYPSTLRSFYVDLATQRTDVLPYLTMPANQH